MFFGDAADAVRGADADVAFGEGIEGNFFRVAFSLKIRAAEEDAFGLSDVAFADGGDFMEGDDDVAGVRDGAADIPEEADFAGVDVVAVDFELTDGDVVAFGGPGSALVVGVFKDVVAEGVDAFIGEAVFAFDAFELVGVVVVEAVDAAE